MRFRMMVRCAVYLPCLAAGIGLPLPAQQPAADPFGLIALNGAYRLMLGELSLNVQQGGMSHFAPFVYPLMSANGVELWGKDASYRADHLGFYIRYGVFSAGSPSVRIRDTDVPNMIGVKHDSQSLDEHLAHQDKLRVVRLQLGAPDACSRDTVLADEGRAITVRSSAVWRRSGGMVLFGTSVTHRAAVSTWSARRPGTPPASARAPFLSATYEVVRSGWLPTGGTQAVPTRQDAGCIIERDELVVLAVPMDSLGYHVLRGRLQRR